MDLKAQLFVDGFISHDELLDLKRRGAVGEVVGWAFDAAGAIIEGGTNARITSVPNPIPARSLTVGVARGRAKVEPIRAALAGRIVDGLITDEVTARALLG
jgi:DNA-binding transcriptional regulator LsrR (DeoR family)